MEDYRNLVEESRQQFQKEIEAILPERKIGKTGGGALSEEDLNIFMTHAYRLVRSFSFPPKVWPFLMIFFQMGGAGED